MGEKWLRNKQENLPSRAHSPSDDITPPPIAEFILLYIKPRSTQSCRMEFYAWRKTQFFIKGTLQFLHNYYADMFFSTYLEKYFVEANSLFARPLLRLC